jgi:hypothetical protein
MYCPYSSTDTFELYRGETTRYEIHRLPIDFVASSIAFAAYAYGDVFGRFVELDANYISVAPASEQDLKRHLGRIDGTDSPKSLKFKEVALRGLAELSGAFHICGRDPCVELLIGRTAEFYVYLKWFTTG